MQLIKTEDQNLIKCVFSGLPPVAWLVDYCTTEDQKKHWDSLRLHCQCVYICIKAYFSGQAPPLLGEYQEVYSLTTRCYIHLYQVIFDAWDELVKAGNKEGFTLESPGKLLIQIVEMECAANLQKCLHPYSEVSPRKLYKQFLKRQKFKKRGLFDNDNPSKKESQQVEQLQAESRGEIRGYELFYVLHCFIRSVATKSKNANVKQSWEIYVATCDRLDAHVNRKFNRTGTVHRWINGERS